MFYLHVSGYQKNEATNKGIIKGGIIMALKKWLTLGAGAFLSIGILAGCGEAEEDNVDMEPEVEEDADVNLEEETDELEEEAEDLGEEIEEGVEDAEQELDEEINEETDEDEQ